ncbi:hypothetical protein KY307_01665 [Candidatus Woesearchaeota archaeon]|nr:hypothetical protein [Candidatus Woesearchaeota archaeon]
MKKINLKILKILIFLSIFVLFSNFAYACWFWCYDSDNGQQYSIKGDIYCEYTLQDSDSCIGDYIKEYYCDGKTIKAVIQSCSDFDFYGDWSDPYCDGNVLKRKRPFYDYYCSDGACKSRTTYDYELIETCQYGCDNGRCNPSPSCDRTDTSCGNYPNCQNCNNKDDWYDVGSPYSCCNGDNTGTCTCQKIEYRDYYCSGTSCSYTVTGTTTKYSNCNLCGTKDCDNLNYYYQTGTESPTSIETCYYRDYQDCTKKCSSGSCHDCSCTSFQNKEQYQCGICKYISPSSCDGSTKGSCSNYPKGTSCGTNKECDGNGNCITILVCGDGSCNGNEDKWSCPQDCGEPCAANQCKEESEKKCYNIGEITPDGKGYCAGHITAWWVYCPEAGSCNQQGNPLIGIPYSYCTNDDNDWRWRQCKYGCDNGKCINCQDECDPAFYPKCDGNDILQCVTDPITGCLVITRSTCKCGCDPYLKACIPESQPKWKCEGKKKVHYDECGNKDQEITCSYECKDGECISDPCEGKPTCDSPGTERCNGNIHEICEQDEQGCYVWEKVEVCEFGCQNNACFSCDIDYCSSHSDVCCNREEVCKQDDICNINCLDYKDPDCGPDCTDECSLGEKQCNGNYLEECGDYDEDECLEFGNPQYCEHGCYNGSCFQIANFTLKGLGTLDVMKSLLRGSAIYVDKKITLIENSLNEVIEEIMVDAINAMYSRLNSRSNSTDRISNLIIDIASEIGFVFSKYADEFSLEGGGFRENGFVDSVDKIIFPELNDIKNEIIKIDVPESADEFEFVQDLETKFKFYEMKINEHYDFIEDAWWLHTQAEIIQDSLFLGGYIALILYSETVSFAFPEVIDFIYNLADYGYASIFGANFAGVLFNAQMLMTEDVLSFAHELKEDVNYVDLKIENQEEFPSIKVSVDGNKGIKITNTFDKPLMIKILWLPEVFMNRYCDETFHSKVYKTEFSSILEATLEPGEDYLALIAPSYEDYIKKIFYPSFPENLSDYCIFSFEGAQCDYKNLKIYAEGPVYIFYSEEDGAKAMKTTNFKKLYERFDCADGPDCTDECSLGEKQCNGNYLEECGDYDEDECLEFGNPQYCEHGCSNNACNSPPSNPGEVIFRDAVWDNDKLTLNQHTWSNIPEKSFYAYQPKEDTQLNYCDRDEEECRPLWKIYMKEMGVDGELGWYRSCNQHGKCKRGICADDLDCEGTNKCIECNGGDYLYTDENGCKHYDTREYKTGWKCVLDTSDGGHPIVFWCMCNGNEVSVGSWCDNDDGETYNTKWVYTTEQISGEEDCGGLDCGAVLESYGFNYESGCDCCHYPNEFNYRQYYKEKLSTEDMNALFKHTRCWIRGEQVRYNGNDFIINYSVEGIPIVHNNHLACLIRYQDWQEQVKDDNGNVANQIGPDSKVLFNFSVIPKVCNPDDKICKGNELMQCNLDGTDFELIEECAFGCENGECLSNPGINNTAPILEAIPPINITEGELIRLIVKATDAENDTLLFKIGYTNITAAANITQIPVICDAIGIRSEGWYDANSNELIEYDFCKGKQASLFEYQTKQGDAGNYTVIITASDGELEDSQEVFIVINKAPVCFPYWQCSDWSSCSNGKQTRTCIDVNDCNTTEGKPSELRTCTVQKKSGGGGGGGSSRRKNKTTTANILKEQNHEKITSTTPKPKNTLSTTSSLPSETELTTKLGETIKFSSRNSNADSYKWYVDDALVSESSSFDYTAQKPGKHKILLVVKGKGVQISRKWTVEVLETNTKGDAVKTTKTATKTEAREDTTSFYGNTSIITKIFNFFKKIFFIFKIN